MRTPHLPALAKLPAQSSQLRDRGLCGGRDTKTAPGLTSGGVTSDRAETAEAGGGTSRFSRVLGAYDFSLFRETSASISCVVDTSTTTTGLKATATCL